MKGRKRHFYPIFCHYQESDDTEKPIIIIIIITITIMIIIIRAQRRLFGPNLEIYISHHLQ